MTYGRGMADANVAAKLGVAVAMVDGRGRGRRHARDLGGCSLSIVAPGEDIAVILLVWYDAASLHRLASADCHCLSRRLTHRRRLLVMPSVHSRHRRACRANNR
jgi:hypothetical protein